MYIEMYCVVEGQQAITEHLSETPRTSERSELTVGKLGADGLVEEDDPNRDDEVDAADSEAGDGKDYCTSLDVKKNRR